MRIDIRNQKIKTETVIRLKRRLDTSCYDEIVRLWLVRFEFIKNIYIYPSIYYPDKNEDGLSN